MAYHIAALITRVRSSSKLGTLVNDLVSYFRFFEYLCYGSTAIINMLILPALKELTLFIVVTA